MKPIIKIYSYSKKRQKKTNSFFALSRSLVCILEIFFSLFKFTKSHQRTMSKVETIVCCSKYCQNDFRYLVEVPRREALASHNLAFPLVFFNLLRWNLSKFSQICENRPADHLNAEKIGLWRQFPRYLQFCVSFLYLKFGPMNFFQQALWRAKNCLTVKQILGN